MTDKELERHLDVYENRYELHQESGTPVFYQGFQNSAAQKRYEKIRRALSKGFLDDVFTRIAEMDYSPLTDANQILLRNMVDGITSEVGRALVGLTCLQLAMSQMRSANKKHGNIGDIELTENGIIMKSWDAKYGKPYLRDELEELRDKLSTHPDVRIAGFICDSAVDLRRDIVARQEELQQETGVEIHLFSFSEWLSYETADLKPAVKDDLGFHWLMAVVESFAQLRPSIAPIDEPCDAWISDLISALK